MLKRSPFMLLVGVAVFLAAGVAHYGTAQANPAEEYCCLCGGCPAALCAQGAPCVLVDVPPMTSGGANVGKTCPTFCPTGCNRSVLLEGACVLHTAAECPLTDPAPVLSLSALVLCIVALCAYGVRQVRRS